MQQTKEPDLRLELLLLSGKRARVPVDRDDTVRDVLDRVWTDWPHEWCATDPPPASATDLRLLHLGRFLEPKATLVDAGLAPSPQPHAHEGDADAAADARPPVVHLHVRTLRPPDTPPRGGGKVKQGVADDTDDEASCCACCIVS
ncbi:hypothetical protein DMC30DRAFT_419336 [Rhodotorula diobovata]|uniref:UBL3-like ubiquitin domain-containing protein n=1 Tax=Rhodotorula diobovata TaxID=5288 RepID=A0A5C5FM47_9BASI|nr:hypothetical protein DMC30DRAFT_419336 [Rhodotorula diobovata]